MEEIDELPPLFVCKLILKAWHGTAAFRNFPKNLAVSHPSTARRSIAATDRSGQAGGFRFIQVGVGPVAISMVAMAARTIVLV